MVLDSASPFASTWSLLVNLGELAERHRRVVGRRIEASLVEGTVPDCCGQFVECFVGFSLGRDLAVRPFFQAHPLAAKAAPPRMLAAIACTSLVLAHLVQTHSFLLPPARCQTPPSIEPSCPD